MITAEEARKQTNQSVSDKTKKQLAEIEASVLEAIKHEKTSINYFNDLTDGTKKELTKLGYNTRYYDNVDIRDPRERPYWIISW